MRARPTSRPPGTPGWPGREPGQRRHRRWARTASRCPSRSPIRGRARRRPADRSAGLPGARRTRSRRRGRCGSPRQDVSGHAEHPAAAGRLRVPRRADADGTRYRPPAHPGRSTPACAPTPTPARRPRARQPVARRPAHQPPAPHHLPGALTYVGAARATAWSARASPRRPPRSRRRSSATSSGLSPPGYSARHRSAWPARSSHCAPPLRCSPTLAPRRCSSSDGIPTSSRARATPSSSGPGR